jgi:hypothetical protein
MKKKKVKEKLSGDFKTKIKFLEFVGGKGHINFLSNQATIEGKYLSGLEYNDLVFKLKIYEDFTVDFDEVDTSQTTKDQRERLLQVIEDQTLVGYRNRTVINELQFTSIDKVKDKTIPLYLAVEYQKPIEKLGSLFDDTELDISDDALSNLNDLLNLFDFDEDIDESQSDTENPISVENKVTDSTYLQEQFSKMKEEKIQELKTAKSKKQNELDKLKIQLDFNKKTIDTLESDVKSLEERIYDLQPVEPPNGYYFFVSERMNEKVELDPNVEKIIKERISKVKEINAENFMKLFTNGEYQIHLAKIKDDSDFEVVEKYQDLSDDLIRTLDDLNLTLEDNKLLYKGEKSWGEIVNKMLKVGFTQNPDFDKHCGSNSYASKENKLTENHI